MQRNCLILIALILFGNAITAFPQSVQNIKVLGEDELHRAKVDSDKRLYTRASIFGKTDLGVEVQLRTDEDGNIYVTSNVLSQVPNFREFLRKVLSSGETLFSIYPISEDTAIKEIHLGGTSACEGVLAKYNSSYVDLFGTFNSSIEVAGWTDTSVGDSALEPWAYATNQFTEGTGSASKTFPKSDGNNYPEITYTFTPALDLSSILKISADIRTSVAAGGNTTRTIQIRLNSGTATRVYQLTGTTTTAPFSTEQWHTVVGTISTPDALAGVGTFDINTVNSISIRLQDGGNKTGTIWVDNVKFLEQINILDKIYTSGMSHQINFDPVIVFDAGEELYLSIKNNSSSSGEIQISASGVAL